MAGETLCVSEGNKKLGSGFLGWKQEQKEEATCNQKTGSETEFHLDL